MNAILGIFTGPYALLAKWGVIAALCAAFYGFAWYRGDQHGTEKLTAYQGAQAVAEVKLRDAQIKVVHDIQTEYRDRIKTVYVKGDTITKEVTKYVTAADDTGCTIPVGFVREYGAMWTNTSAGPPSESDRGPSGVQLSAVADSDSGNARSCFVYKEQRDGLIKLYRQLQQAK